MHSLPLIAKSKVMQQAIKNIKELKNAHILDQYGNLENPKVHAEATAEEIIEDFPELTNEQILACLHYAANKGNNTRILAA